MRLFTDGAEMRDTAFWDIANGVSINAGGISPYYYSCSLNCTKYFTASNEIYFRVRVTAERRRTDERFIQIRSGTNIILWANSNASSGYWATIYGDTTTIFTPYTWYLVEIYFKLADAGGRFIFKVDGNTLIDYTGDTNPGSYTGVDNFYSEMYDGRVVYLDDLALNNADNSDGKNDTSWCGDGIIVKITPSGSGIVNDWLNNGSVSGSANYLYVDEYPNDGDTTYVYTNGFSSGCQTNFAMSNDFDSTNKTITRIYAEGRARKTSADNYGIKIGTIASGGTNVLSASQVLTVGAYSRIVGPEAKVNPVTSASWVKANIDGLEFVSQIP